MRSHFVPNWDQYQWFTIPVLFNNVFFSKYPNPITFKMWLSDHATYRWCKKYMKCWFCNITKSVQQMAPGSCHRVCTLVHHIILDCHHLLWHLAIVFRLPPQYAPSVAHHTSHPGSDLTRHLILVSKFIKRAWELKSKDHIVNTYFHLQPI